jgi:hypothetical protein
LIVYSVSGEIHVAAQNVSVSKGSARPSKSRDLPSIDSAMNCVEERVKEQKAKEVVQIILSAHESYNTYSDNQMLP